MKAKNISILAISLIGLTLPVSGQSRTNSALIRLPQEARSATVWQKPPGWFESVPGGWRSVNSPWNVQITSNLYVIGAVRVITPDNIEMHAVPVALSYYEPASQSNVMVALPKICTGYLAASNQIVFPDCWEGLKSISIRYTLHNHSLAQDLLINGELPDPVQYGLKPEGLRIQAWSEFTGTQEPRVITSTLPQKNDTNIVGGGENQIVPPWVEDHISFGKTAMLPGKSFIQPASQTSTRRQPVNLASSMTPVTKRWVSLYLGSPYW